MKLRSLVLVFWLAAVVLLADQGPTQSAESVQIGVLNLDPASGPHDTQMLAAARLVAERWNAKGGVDGSQIAVVALACSADAKSIRAGIAKLTEAGALAVIAPIDDQLAEVARRAARGKLVCISFRASTASTVEALSDLFKHRYCATRIALVRDKSAAGKGLAKAMKKDLPWPAELVFEMDLKTKPDVLSKKLGEARPEVLVVDSDPESAAAFLLASATHVPFDTILTPRTVGPALIELEREATLLLGRSPLTMPQTGALLAEYEAQHGPIGFGMAEGYEAMSLLLEAIDRAEKRTVSSIAKALEDSTHTGLRGTTRCGADELAADAPLALWKVSSAGLVPYFPGVLPPAVPGASSKTPTLPDRKLGEPFGTRRTHQFRFEEDTQWVLCSWGSAEEATIDDDLMKLGLSTGAKSVLLDRIVKDELMARILSITSTKFRRQGDGTSVPGESLGISFSTKLPKKAKSKGKLWPAVFAGDDEAAGGRAFGDRCEIYSSFMRRTIYEAHALKPPVGPEDLAYLDGSYKFGTEPLRDLRSERIRSLIDAYAGSMALTAAHEVGHLGGLGHVTGDPVAIMNVEEGAGLDYREAHFCEDSFEKLTKRLELTE